MAAEPISRFAEAWETLTEAAGVWPCRGVGLDLLDAYCEPHRRYHDVGHIVFLLDEIERCAARIADPVLLGIAAFFHDAVYKPLAQDNEERSADWALRILAQDGPRPYGRADAVAALILKTKSHHAGKASNDEALFLDMDFAILGAPREIYAAYADAIRAEYAAVPEDRFRAGRAAFLSGVLAQERMFRTDVYEAEFGASARENLIWEIERLGA